MHVSSQVKLEVNFATWIKVVTCQSMVALLKLLSCKQSARLHWVDKVHPSQKYLEGSWDRKGTVFKSSFHYFFSPSPKNGFNRSMGTGKIVVELFSVAISRKV
jgi:hypothetical protein